jgi:hypothetical protein
MLLPSLCCLRGVTESTTDLDMADASTGWRVDAMGEIWKTADGGRSWTEQLSTDLVFGSGLFVVAAPTALHAWAGGSSGQVIDTVGGATWSLTTITADQASAPRITVRSPFGASGKPGSSVKLTLSQLPSGYESRLTGRRDYPASSASTLRDYTSRGGASETLALTVPRNATPGYFYWFGLHNRNGLLSLEVPFQVATLKASRGSVSAGAAMRFTGVVPTQGHVGSKAGKKKRVFLWMSAKSPTKGFKRVALTTCKGNGAYAFENVRPKRTAWWIVVYTGDGWYWEDATSPVRVTVR